MKLTDIIKLVEARVVAGNPNADCTVEWGFSSDLMSDVLTLDNECLLLITGLANIQLIRTAEIADIEVVVLARNKKASPAMISLANEIGLILLESPYSVFKASGILYQNGLKPVY